MTRIAELRIEVNSTQVEQSVRDLERLKQAAQESGKVAATGHDKAAQAVDKRRSSEERAATQAEASAKREAKALDATVSRLDARIKAQLEYNRTVQQLNQSESSGSISTAEKDSYLQLAAARRDAALAAQQEITASQKTHQQAERLLGSLDKQVKAKNTYAQVESELNQLREAGTITEQEYTTAIVQAAEKRDEVLLGGSRKRVREEERAAARAETTAKREAKALDATVSRLDARIKAQIEYNQTVQQLNQAESSGTMSTAEKDSYVQLAAARRDAALAAQEELTANQRSRQQADRLLGSLDKQIKAKNEYAQTESQLNQLRDANIISEQEYSNAVVQAAERRDKVLVGSAKKRIEAERELNQVGEQAVVSRESQSKREAKALDSTISRLDDRAKAQIEYNRTIQQLDQAESSGLLSAAEKDSYTQLAAARRDAVLASQEELSASEKSRQHADRLLGSLDKQVKAKNDYAQTESQLNQLREAGIISEQEYSTAIIQAAEKRDKAFSTSSQNRINEEEKATARQEANLKREAKALDATVSRLDDRIKAQVEYNKTLEQLDKAESSGLISGAERESYSKLAEARRDAALAVEDEAAAAEKSRQQADRLIGSVDKQTKAVNDYTKVERELGKLRDAGIVSEEEYSSAITKAAEKRDNVLAGGTKARISEEERLQKALSKTVASLDPVAAANQRYEQSLATLNEARQRGVISEQEYSTRAAQASDKLEAAKQKNLRASQTQEQQLRSLVAAIDPYAMELQRLARLERELDAAQKSGQFDNNPQEYQRLNSLLATNRRELERRSAAMNKATLSAKQLQQAQLQLPAQFTDIAVSLQGGQNPLTVFLQQGGQLKDLFGGIVPALKAMTGYVVGLINPFTILAATTVALAVAWRQADKEAENINRAVLLTGTSFNFTAAEVRKSAERIADATGVSIGAATNHLLTFVEQGKVTRSTIDDLTSTAIKLSKLGIPIEDATRQLSAIGDDPVKAVVDLNEKYGILNATIYDQAAALVEQGKEQEAVELVAEQAARDLETRSADIITRYSAIAEVARNSVQSLKNFWDGVRGIFRGESGTEIELGLGDSQERINNLRDSIVNMRENLELGRSANASVTRQALEEAEANLAAEIEIRNELIERRKEEQRVTAEKNEQLDLQRDAVSAASDQRAVAGTLLSQEERIRRQIEDNNKNRRIQLEDARARLQGEELVNAEKAINQRSTEIQIGLEKRLADAQRSGRRRSADLDTTGTEAIKQQLEATRREYEAFQQGIDQQRRLGVLSESSAAEARIRLLEQEAEEVEDAYNRQLASIDQLLQTENLSASQRNTLANRRLSIEGDLNKALQEIELERQEIATNERVRLNEQAANLQNYVTTLQLEYEKLAESGRQEAALITIGGRAAEAFQERLALEEDFLARKRELDNRRLEEGENFSQEEYDTYLAQAEEFYAKSLERAKENARLKREAEQDWVGGARAGLQDWLADSNDVAGQVRDVVSGAFEGMTDALHEFVTTGKLDFRSFASSVISDMARIAAQAAASQGLSAVLGGLGGGSSTSFLDNLITTKQADGGVWDQGVQKFAKGGAFTNSVVSSPTMFAMGGAFGGLGVMGEAGEEAIMPLKRGPDGSLGVVAYGANGGNGGVAVYITIDEKGNPQTSTSGGSGLEAFGREVGNFVEQKYTQLVNRDLKPGGQIYGAINNR